MKTKLFLLLLGMTLCLTGCGEAARGTTEISDERDFGTQENTEIALDMVNAMDSELEIDIESRLIMTGKDTPVRSIPDETGKVNRTLSYQMVDVYAVVHGKGYTKWALVGFFCFDEAYNNIGWVNVSDLMEYKEENYKLLQYPVIVKEGCVDLDQGEAVAWNAFRVEYIDDYAQVSREGGWSRRVDPKDIVYPAFEKAEIVPQGYMVEPDGDIGEFDYECYIVGLNLSADGKDDKLCIRQIQYIYASDTEEIKEYGLENIDWTIGYHIVDDSEEILELPINEDTEFYVWNWGHEQTLADQSVNRSIEGWCLLKDPVYFFEYMQSEYGDWLPNYPMFIIMDESGYVHQVVELPLA